MNLFDIKQRTQGQEKLYYRVRGRRPSDFAIVEVEHDEEDRAKAEAKHLFANGYNVKVWFCTSYKVADWTHDDAEKEDVGI